ncbi:class I SAM-dependent methyltransferase [Plastoroseomonas arctica]|uniref:Class I SAM-dependent methyltransferase n=1 Tax=Plastoroseomonas arctica TaxID=1509237 RepID=A0AAF1KRC0_9PROT|nr:class I SAM-dependent methyltransferase [Plastoroseomonas arctica]MBR0654117.1 class I SAM-dependent methyltransferase [Plastoroseomonas arctica]
MFAHIAALLSAAEHDPRVASRNAAIQALRQLGLDDFGQVLLAMPHADFPKLSALLPAMASPDVQMQWTGNHGEVLLRQSCNFIRSLVYNHALVSGAVATRLRVLDYGCGYGRLARLMYYFVDPEDLHGVDPWHRSIEECAAAGLGPNFTLSAYLPRSLPVSGSFELAYAFSVFTHLSEHAARLALAAIRARLATGGVLAITIRPPEYWSLDVSGAGPEDRARMRVLHDTDGFAFHPHDLPPVEGELTYGDTSMTLDWLARAAPGYAIRRIDRSLEDPYQLYVFMQAT